MHGIRIVARDGRDRLGEGLFWAADEGALYWTDILGQALNRLVLASGAVTRWAMPEMIGWVIGRRDAPGFIAGLQSGFAALTLDPLEIRPIHNPHPHLPGNRMNDAKADAAGRIWAGSMHVDADRPSGALHRLDPNGAVRTVDSGYIVANGPALSPDQRWLYHTDTGHGTIYRFALAGDGSLGERVPFIRFEEDWGKPDGMTVDAEGHLWVAHWGGARVSRFSPEGRFERSIPLPASQITNVCFAGPDLDRMFVTSAAEGREAEPDAGALFEIDPGVRGLLPGLYG